MALNTEQKNAVYCNDRKILCLAGAGTGKTHSMISRIERLVSEGVSPVNILVLTFTEKAAFEMSERYIKNNKSAITPKFCTFHSFCYSLIIDDINIRNHLGYTAPPSVVDDEEYKQIMSKLKLKLGLKISDKKLFGDGALSLKEKYEYDLLKKALTNQLIKDNLITFDTMCYSICELFKSNNPLVEKYKSRFKYVFVDEFQDTDPKQYDFITSFTNANLFVVGDIQQAIYGFRGADSSIIKSLADSNEWTTIKLIHNYRSTKQICDFSNEICKINNTNINSNYVIDLEADRNGSEVFVDAVESFDRVKYILREKLLQSGLVGSTAILVRTNSEVSLIKRTLDALKIHYSTNKNKDEDIEKILKSSIDDEYALKYLSSQLNSSKYSEYMRLSLYDEAYTTLPEFLTLYCNEYNVNIKYGIIRKVKSALNAPFTTPYQKCLNICRILNIPSSVKDLKLTGSDNENIINTILSVLNSDTSAYDIYVGTIHSSKGLEYNNVLLFGASGSKFKLTTEENRNIYYVGCTRAKDNLFIYRGDI